MEFNTEEYKRRGSNVFTSADGFKYVQSKIPVSHCLRSSTTASIVS